MDLSCKFGFEANYMLRTQRPNQSFPTNDK